MSDSNAIPTPAAGVVAVCSLSQAKRHKRRWDAVLTIEDPNARLGDRLRFTTQPAPAHLVLQFEDVDTDAFGYATATNEQIAQAIAFGRSHADKSLLVHCFHGVGRSAAIALAIIADRLGPGREMDAVNILYAQRPQAMPNLVALSKADTLLGRNEKLLSTVLAIEDSEPARQELRRMRYQFAQANPHLFCKQQ